MTVKQLICGAMRLVGRDDAADAVENDTATEEMRRLQKALLIYMNAVRDELARGYFPLEKEEAMSSQDGRFAFANFSEIPVKINRVTDGKKSVEWHICPDYLVCEHENVTVFYEYAPKSLGEDDEFVFPLFGVSEYLVQCGMAAEYFLVRGDGNGYSSWEEKYRDGIENALSHSPVRGRIPPRRWI